jgi:hypothetical protein
MDGKILNELDGDAVYQEVSKKLEQEKIEINRRKYKREMLNYIRKYELQKYHLEIVQKRLDKACEELGVFIKGGMQGFLCNLEDINHGNYVNFH